MEQFEVMRRAEGAQAELVFSTKAQLISKPRYARPPSSTTRPLPPQAGEDTPKPAPAFKCHTSPAKTYGFKEMTAQYGYDPRGTSVYWIEKRADALRRKWRNYGRVTRGEIALSSQKLPVKTDNLPEDARAAQPTLKFFEPVDADYNSVWPPIILPDAPPKDISTESRVAITSMTLAIPVPRENVQGCERAPELGQNSHRNSAEYGVDGGARATFLPSYTTFTAVRVEAIQELGQTAPMSLLTRVLTAGARLFGPPPRIDEDGQPGQIEPAGVTAALIALGAKMAKSDGVVTADEIDAFKRVFQASPENDAMIGRFFDLARQTTLGFERYAAIVAKKFRAQPAALEDVLDGLFHIALADGIVTDNELSFLEKVSDIFGFSDQEFKRIKVAHMGRASDDPYLILGLEEHVTDSEVKRAYRRMAAANHPDRLMSRGLPKELIGLANHKMAMINKAYDEIKKQRSSRLPKLHGPTS